jgi:hypothetical protein
MPHRKDWITHWSLIADFVGVQFSYLSGFVPIAIAAYCSTVASIDDLGALHDRDPKTIAHLTLEAPG